MGLLASLLLLTTAWLPGVWGHGGEEHPSRTRGGRFDRMAVLLVTFRNEDLKQTPPSRERARQIVLDETVKYFKTVSYGKELLSGEIFPPPDKGDWYTLPMDIPVDSDGRCKSFFDGGQLDSVRDLAIEAADPDVDFSRFGRLILIYPQSCGPGWGTTWEPKLKTKEGRLDFTVSWIGELSMRVLPHELGHNMTLQHASSYFCEEAALKEGCFDDEYGDRADSMGGSGPRHFNAWEKHQAGWIDAEQFPAVPNRSGSYRYELGPLELEGGIKGLRIPQNPDAGADEPFGKEFILEYRKAIPGDYDETLAAGFLNGALIHIPWNRGHVDQKTGETSSAFWHTHLLDMDPGSDDTVLRAGRSWTSPNEHVKIKVGRKAGDKLVVHVVVGKSSFEKLVQGLWGAVAGAGKGAWDALSGLFGGKDQDAGSADGAPAADPPGIRAAGLPKSVHRHSTDEPEDTLGLAGFEEASALGLAPIPSAGAPAADVCAGKTRLRRLPSPLKERYNDEARARGISNSVVPCISPGELLAHREAFERLRSGNRAGAIEMFTWEGLAVLKAERATLDGDSLKAR